MIGFVDAETLGRELDRHRLLTFMAFAFVLAPGVNMRSARPAPGKGPDRPISAKGMP
jgi:hypothetical protein